MINVTKTFLPTFDEYATVLKRAWDKAWITNNGELVLELEARLKEYLGVPELLFCSNGTVVLQMALKALNITGEVITTPFSYVATTNAIIWSNATPVFVDINPDDCCINADLIEEKITPKTQAILATHVYGFPCDVDRIEAIARKHNLKVIYDAAHAFGCRLNGRSLISYGDISTCSFHATKSFHTVEGGSISTNDKEIGRKLMLFRQFGHVHDDYFSVGINGKNSEFHAAMGLCMLPRLEEISKRRKEIFECYDRELVGFLHRPFAKAPEFEYNYLYYMVIFRSEDELLNVKKALILQNVNARRYFFPSLNKLPFIEKQVDCIISEDVSVRVLSLPVYHDLQIEDVIRICKIIKDTLNK